MNVYRGESSGVSAALLGLAVFIRGGGEVYTASFSETVVDTAGW